MTDHGMDVETTGGYRVPLDNWNDLANYLGMQRVRLTLPFIEKLTLLRSMEPEFQNWQAERRNLTERWMRTSVDPRP
jgi:hypothetical protein